MFVQLLLAPSIGVFVRDLGKAIRLALPQLGLLYTSTV